MDAYRMKQIAEALDYYGSDFNCRELMDMGAELLAYAVEMEAGEEDFTDHLDDEEDDEADVMYYGDPDTWDDPTGA